MTEHKIIVDKPTVPVGTADKVKSEITSVLVRRNSIRSFDDVSNPEFLKEGAAVADCMNLIVLLSALKLNLLKLPCASFMHLSIEIMIE